MTDVKTDEIVLDISEEALFKVLDVRAAEEEGDALGLRVEVTGVEGVDYAYDLAFEPIAEAAETDVLYTIGELSVMVPEDSVDKLRGATLDLPSNPMQGGLVIRNPNRPSLQVDSSIELTGSIGEKVQQLLAPNRSTPPWPPTAAGPSSTRSRTPWSISRWAEGVRAVR